MKITWHGTASLTLSAGLTNVLVDPFIPMAGSTVPTRLQTYDGVADVLITHAHIDHISSLPQLEAVCPRQIFGTAAVGEGMKRLGMSAPGFRRISPGQSFQLGDLHVTVYQGQHIRFDRTLVRRTLLSYRMLTGLGRFVRMLPIHLRCREQGETVAYLVEADGRRVFILGSLGLLSSVDYPTDVDLLVLPYQGSSNLLPHAMTVVERIHPRAIMLDHFDDTFPPLSAEIDTTDVMQALSGRIPVIRPVYHQPYEV